jgi:Ca-activated chloride channel family protein
MIIWCLLVSSAARPQWVGDPIALPLTGRDILIAIDVSGSMETPDFNIKGQQVNRLDVVKTTAGEFIQRREGDNLGLILFGTQAYLQTPLTFDRATVKAMLDDATIGLAGKDTAIGDAIGLAVKRLRDNNIEHRILILLTDGANTSGEVDPLKAAELAASEGLKIYTIGIGADSMQVGASFLFGPQTINPSRDLDEKTLKTIADSTGGKYFRARDTQGLEDIYSRLDELEPRESDSEFFRPTQSLFYWPLGLALLLSLLPGLIKLTKLATGRNA